MYNSRQQRILAARDALVPLANKAELEPVYWIGGSDEGIDWCRECAEAKIKALRAANPGEEYYLDGGCDLYHCSDGVASCDSCGKALGYSLTEYGVGAEAGHFLENGILDSHGILHERVVFEIVAMLEGAEYTKDEELAAAALRVGEVAVSLLGYDGEVSRYADDGNMTI